MSSSRIFVSNPLNRSIFALVISALLALVLTGRVLAAPVDVNSADATTLAEALNGVGPKIAAAIVSYRKEHGPFNNVQDLLKVKGIGPRILERNRKDILLNKDAKSVKTGKVK